ncbi:hypothetical protein [Synechococcus sp. A18-25c]|uniref:hypothetical protein n=1 Tax=Synechococcus sp. A18-25c TaxID=1866938 RepID=UPI00164934D1|nr:hypothetical protein [Synechococcus sp. A18-25c]
MLETKKEDDSCETNNKETGKCQVHFFHERDRIQIMTKATLLQSVSQYSEHHKVREESPGFPDKDQRRYQPTGEDQISH